MARHAYKYVRNIHEDELSAISTAIWAAEEKFRPDNPIRKELYKIRVQLGLIKMMNRQDKDHPQDANTLEMSAENPPDVEVPLE